MRRWLAALALIAMPLSAQHLTGIVRDARAAQPVAGAPVTLVDVAGAVTARTVTSRDGTFRLPVDPRARTVQVRRIGFRPHDVAIPDSAHTSTASLVITIDPIPAVLEPVVSQAVNCPASPTEGRALAYWEQARLGLLATVVARDAYPPTANLIRYQREEDRGVTTSQFIRTGMVVSGRPFRSSISGEQAAAAGYSTAGDNGGTVLHSPDADVLLSDAFRSLHCFDMAPPDSAHVGQIGVRFSPARVPAGVTEVAGTLWMDPSPLAIRSLRFRFTQAGLRSVYPNGGSALFRTLDNGLVVVDDWEVRQLGYIEGGVIESARWPDGTVLLRPLGIIEGTVVDRTTGRPLAGMVLDISNGPYRKKSGEDGTVRFDRLLDGPYRLSVTDSLWAPFGLGRATLAPVTMPVARRDQPVVPVRIEMESVAQAMDRRCRDSPRGKGTANVAGRVVGPDGKPVLATRVSVATSALESSRSGTTMLTVENETFIACHLLSGPVTFTATARVAGVSGDLRATASVTLAADSITMVTIQVRR